MGFLSKLFGGGKKSKQEQPRFEPPPAPKVKTAEELFQEAIGFGKREYPYAYGARESALKDIGLGQGYYAGWQPTSFEEALGNQYFANIMPDIERSIKHNLSLSGIESSPALASLIARERGTLGVDIGQYLSNLANERARYSLMSRMGIDPYSVISPYLGTSEQQSNLQSQYNYQNDLLRAQEQFRQSQERAAGKGAKRSVLSTLAGGGIGFLLGGPPGAMLGASLGGMASPLFGGTTSPIDFGDALSVYSILNKTPSGVEPVYKQGGAWDVFSRERGLP